MFLRAGGKEKHSEGDQSKIGDIRYNYLFKPKTLLLTDRDHFLT